VDLNDTVDIVSQQQFAYLVLSIWKSCLTPIGESSRFCVHYICAICSDACYSVSAHTYTTLWSL